MAKTSSLLEGKVYDKKELSALINEPKTAELPIVESLLKEIKSNY